MTAVATPTSNRFILPPFPDAPLRRSSRTLGTQGVCHPPPGRGVDSPPNASLPLHVRFSTYDRSHRAGGLPTELGQLVGEQDAVICLGPSLDGTGVASLYG